MKQALADALEERGYSALTQVQDAVTKPDLADADLLVSAQTGSGKTVGFGLAIAGTILGEGERFDKAAAPLALVIAPTRELALQVNRELSWLYAKAGVIMASCVGGMDMRDERRALARGAHIVVATPGRLRDHVSRGSINLNSLRAVVLDEADEMLDLGFREDLEYILGETPDSRRTLLFSATVPRAIANLAKNYQKDAVRVTTLDESSQHSDIEYLAMNVSPSDGENAIINVLRYYEAPNALVFCNTRAMVTRLAMRLHNRGFSVVSLSGELTQNERTHALQAMRDGRARVCVATDVAARGIDLPNLDLVVHAELPTNHETLLHRSGRTGRAGRKGVSALIVPPKSRRKSERILNSAKVKASWGEAPSAAMISERDHERLMADPMWTQTVSESRAKQVDDLTERFDARQIAAAFLQLYHSNHSAPEELSAPGAHKESSPRSAFGPSVWFAITGGREQGAEPGRILPMICKAGNLSKEDIGAIRIQPDTSYVEIRKSSVDGFLKALGGNMQIEPGAVITQLDKPPAAASKPRERFSAKRSGDKRSEHRGQDRAKPAGKPRASQKSAPIDWDDDSKPRKKKPKAGPKGDKRDDFRKPKSPERTHPEGAVAPYQPKSGSDAASGKPKKNAEGKGKNLAPAVGKPSSKKNRARAKLAAEQKSSTAKDGKARSKRNRVKPSE